MIDTVILSIPKEQVITTDRSNYGVGGWDLQSRTQAYEKYTKNPSSKDKERGYYPRLTGYKRNGHSGPTSTIRIEFSVPKILYSNNLDELVDADLSDVVGILERKMNDMGVIVSAKSLREASVVAVHYSKNVELTEGYTSQFVIGELNKINLNKRFDLTRARFMNDGQSLYAYTQSHSFVIYDKVADLARGKNRSIDRDQTPFQLNLFDALSSKKSGREILRFEVRLCQKRKLNSLFEKLGFAENPTFADVFSTEKSKAVLAHYWKTMLNGNGMVLFGNTPTNKDVLKHLLRCNKDMKAKEAIYRIGLVWLLREGNGMRELRTILAKHTNERTWYRVAKDAKNLEDSMSKVRPREWHEEVVKALNSYQPLRVEV